MHKNVSKSLNIKKIHTSISTHYYLKSTKCCFHNNWSYKVCRCFIEWVKNKYSWCWENKMEGWKATSKKIEEGGRATKQQLNSTKFRRKITSAKNAFRARLPSKLRDAAIPMRSAETELQSTRELRAMASEIVAPKPDAQSEKKTILKHFLKRFLEGKSLAPKWRKSADKSLSQPSCSHSNTIYKVQLQKTIVLRMQPQHEATLTQPLQCDLRRLSCKTQ